MAWIAAGNAIALDKSEGAAGLPCAEVSAVLSLLLEEGEENPKGFIVFAEAAGGLNSSSNVQKGCS